ncbi:MAG TPA: hypothetical protein VHY84_13465 [Bryobacteraceae bacterium]|jgi:uncharacterized protein (TIGR03437 family)|nr:hypothetical protein [Bryobacteraceae bacterium]
MTLRSPAAALALFSGFAFHSSAQTTTLNLSHDLVANDIASANMTPGQPSLDSRPLLEAAIAYAGKNGVATLTADPGTYYFLSLHNANTHVFINGASNLTLDFQNSLLLFAFSNVSAIQCTNCTNVTLQKFAVDYQQLPFTQVTVASVNSAGQSFTYQAIPGYQDPTAFNVNRASDGSDAIFMFVFHNGIPIQQVGRLTASRPVSGGVISITDVNDPWATPASFAAIQSGDTVVFSDRSGPPAIDIVSGQNVIVKGVSIYSSGQIGLYFGRTNGPTADHVQVIPEPGTSRLISTNADGIHTSFALGANIFTNNIVRRTCDDALAISAPWLANVTQVSGTTVTVSRSFGSPFPPGVSVSFINPVTAAVVGTATISSETPAYAQQTLTDGETVTLTLDRAITGLAANFGIVDTDPTKLGGGSVVAYNTVQEGVFARGVWLAGVTNVSVHDNYIQRTSSNGIFVQQLNADNTDAGPSSNITIQNNLVDSSIGYANVSHGVTFAAASIYTVSQNSQNAEVTGSPHSNIAVTGNRVTNAARSGIRIESVAGAQLTGNTIQGFGLAPDVNAFTTPACCETLAQYKADFAQPLLTPTSTSVTSNGNQSSSAAALIQTSSSANGYPRLGIGSFAAAYGTGLAAAPVTASTADFPPTLGGVRVVITDSAGVTQVAPVQYVSPTQVNFIVPDGTAPGVATVTIGSSSGAAQIDTIGAGLYSANPIDGVAAATAALYSANGTITPVTVFQCNPACVSLPMSLGAATDQLAVTLYGTGFRNLSSSAGAAVTVGGAAAKILYIGAQPTEAGLDQLDIVVPQSLAGAGEVPVVLTVDGQTANSVTLNIQ